MITYTGANEHSGARAAARRPARRDARRRRPHHRRAGARPGRSRATRCSPTTRATCCPAALAGEPAPFSFDRAALGRRPARGAPRRGRLPPLLTGPLPARPPRGRLARRPQGVPRPPGAGVPAPAARRRRRRCEADEVGDAIPIDARRPGAVGRSATGCCASCSPATTPTARDDRRAAARHAAAGPARRGRRCSEVVAECQRAAGPAPPTLRAGDRAHRRRRRRPGRRAPAHRHGRRRLRHAARLARLLPAQGQAAAAARGSTCSRSAPRAPTSSWTAHAVGRERAGPRRALAGPLDHRAAERGCATSSSCATAGLREPLPLPVATAAAWAEAPRPRAGRRGRLGRCAGRARAWETDPYHAFGIEGEDADAYHRRVYGDARPAVGAARRRPGRARLAGLGAAARRRREGGPAVTHRRPVRHPRRRCPARAPPCSRPAPAPARPGPSARW